jgi:dolichol kinase
MLSTTKSILARKVLHLSILVPYGAFLYLSLNYSRIAGVYVLLVFLFMFFLYETLRLDTNIKVPFGSLIKKREENHHVDGLNLYLNIVLVSVIFPTNIAFVAILIGVVGDALATIGSLYGKIKPRWFAKRKTTLESYVLFVVFGSMVAGITLGWGWEPFVIGVFGASLESFLKNMDDNLVVPISVAMLTFLLYNI